MYIYICIYTHIYIYVLKINKKVLNEKKLFENKIQSQPPNKHYF